MSVSLSITLYDYEIYEDSLSHTARNNLVSVQHVAALTIAQAYRRVSTATILVVAGEIPYHITA